MEKKNNSLIIILIVIILGLGGFIVYDKVLRKDNSINTFKNNSIDKSKNNLIDISTCDKIDNVSIRSMNSNRNYDIENTAINTDYITCTIGNKVHLVDNKVKEIKITEEVPVDDYIDGLYEYIFVDSNKHVFNFIYQEMEFLHYNYYSADFKKIDDVNGNIYNAHIYTKKDKTVNKYDLDGNLESSRTINDGKLLDIILNKEVIIRNKELLLIDFDTNRETKVATLDYDYDYIPYYNAYYNGNLPVHFLNTYFAICNIQELVEKYFKDSEFYGEKSIPDGFQILLFDKNNIDQKGHLYTITDDNKVVENTFRFGSQCF